MKRIVGLSAAAIFVLTALILFTFSPAAEGLFDSGNDSFDDLASLLAAAAAITAGVIVGVAGIVAGCMLARRLGYDPMSGLLLLIPVANLLVFFYWAFRESPNEKKIRLLKQQKTTS